MAETVKKSFDSPEETRSIDKGTVEVLNLGGVQVMRATFQPGWKWSECVKPVAGTDSCQVAHLVYTLSGRMAIRMDDGSETEVGRAHVGTPVTPIAPTPAPARQKVRQRVCQRAPT